MRKVAVSCGLIEALALMIYAISVLVQESAKNGVRGSGPHPLVLFIIFQIFAVAIALVARAIWFEQSWARTPFGLIQVFALLVFAYLPINGTSGYARLAGFGVATISITALWALIRIRPAN